MKKMNPVGSMWVYTYTCDVCREEYGSDYPNDKRLCHICGIKLGKRWGEKNANS